MTTGEIMLVCGEPSSAGTDFNAAVQVAERYRLPHQVQRLLRASRSSLPDTHQLAAATLSRLTEAPA